MDNQSRDRTARAEAREQEANRHSRIMARDAGLSLIGRANRWMVTGAVGVTGAVSLYASHAFHPQRHSSAARTGTTASAASATQTSTGSTATSTDPSGLSAPQSAPVPASAAPSPVVSGGS
jgi:hypothetical protein